MERSPSAVQEDLAAPAAAAAREATPSPGRLETFSDGVFSVIITLLVLDLRVPRVDALPSGRLGAALLQEWPVYVAFVISFLQVGVVWANHHTMFHYIRRTDHLLLVFNLLLLLSTAVLPFTTALLSEYVRGTPDQQRLAARIYSGALMASGVFFNDRLAACPNGETRQPPRKSTPPFGGTGCYSRFCTASHSCSHSSTPE